MCTLTNYFKNGEDRLACIDNNLNNYTLQREYLQVSLLLSPRRILLHLYIIRQNTL